MTNYDHMTTLSFVALFNTQGFSLCRMPKLQAITIAKTPKTVLSPIIFKKNYQNYLTKVKTYDNI